MSRRLMAPSVTTTRPAAADVLDAAEAAGWTFWYAVILGDCDEWHRKRPGKRSLNAPRLGPLISAHWGDICRVLEDRRSRVLLAEFTPDEQHRIWLLQLHWSAPQDALDACMVADWIGEADQGDTPPELELPF
jgi:hypothetical protein